MFHIRRIFDDLVPVNRTAIEQVIAIHRAHFPSANEDDRRLLAERLRNPFAQHLQSILYVAERRAGSVVGFALVMRDADLGFVYLDYIATAASSLGGGVGGALYAHLRAEALRFGAVGVFFECLPDDPEACDDPALLPDNRARLKFYERYGARPIVGTDYERPVKPGDTCMPHLVFDGLGRDTPLAAAKLKHIVRAILERKYGYLCPPEYVTAVVRSIREDPVQLRPPRYVKGAPPEQQARPPKPDVPLFFNDRHDIHHVRERGYVEAPIRVASILRELEGTGRFDVRRPKTYPLRHVESVHDPDFVRYLRRVCLSMPKGRSVYPYVFPVRNAARPPKDLSVRAGYYCIDTFTPLNRNAFVAARRAVDCALAGADALLSGSHIAYALVRPPGHHAEHRSFGGFCYFNNAAVAAQRLSLQGRVAILDIDYHHGNGQQDIFYRRNDVLTVSIHGDPSFAYPYFSGFDDERGEEAGAGTNLNVTLPEKVDGKAYLKALDTALSAVKEFRPTFLIVALGLDTAKGDPTGSWTLAADDFEKNGRRIGALELPTLVVQEGGYKTRTLGKNARRFFTGLLAERES